MAEQLTGVRVAALVAQGFVLGGLIFFATHGESLRAQASDALPPLAAPSR